MADTACDTVSWRKLENTSAPEGANDKRLCDDDDGFIMSHDVNTIARTTLALVWSPRQPLLGRPACSTHSHLHTAELCKPIG